MYRRSSSLWNYVAAASGERFVDRYNVSHITMNDGLPHNSISDIYKDRQGFVWLCTWYGLSRFDGYSFRNYRTVPGDSAPLSHGSNI